MERVKGNTAITIMDGEENPIYEVNRNGDICTTGAKVPKNVVIVSGRSYVSVKLKKVNKYYQVGRIVLESFIGKSKLIGHDIVGFRDGDCSNNSLDNLYWTDKRKWWIDPATTISEEIINKIKEVREEHPDVRTSTLAKKIQVPKDMVEYVLHTLRYGVPETLEEIVESIDVHKEEIKEECELITETPFDYVIDEEFKEIFGDVMTVNSLHDKIIREDIPALLYAGISKKKILKYILYRYGNELYEHFKEHQSGPYN